jgi:hypothetical protein
MAVLRRRLPAAVLAVTLPLAALSSAPPASAAGAVVAWGTTATAAYGYIGSLYGVAAASASDVWAVGAANPDHQGSQVLDQPYAEHWNGTAWSATAVSAPSLYGSSQEAALNAVAAVGPGAAWAVGTVSNLSSLASQTLAYQWNGTTWTRVATPDPAGAANPDSLAAVAVRSATDVWAAGYTGYPATSLLEHWNGTVWATVAVPNIGPLSAVAVNSSTVWVAGATKVEQYSGGTWSALPTVPVTGSATLGLGGLVDTAAGLWAVGTSETAEGEGYYYHSYAALYTGSSWTQIPSAGAGFSTAAAAPGGVLAAGSNTGVYLLTTSGATQQVTPPLGTVYPVAAATDPAGDAWAVGFTGNGTGSAPALMNAPGIGQGGIVVATGVSNATVTWIGPASGSGTTNVSGGFQVGGLPDGSYTVTASYSGCTPGVANVTVSAGVATVASALINCPN